MSGSLQHLPMVAWLHTLLSHLAISSLPWQICSSHQAVYRTSLWNAFSHAVALQVSSLSELEISSKDTMPCDNTSSSSEPFSSSPAPAIPSSSSPERTMSGMQSGITPNCWSHCLLGAWDSSWDPVPDSLSKPDPDELELLEPEVLPE